MKRSTIKGTLISSLAGLAMTACLTATAVTVIDITSAGAPGNGDSANGAIFNYANPQPTGTGFIDPFLREQVPNSGVEFGVNTSIKAQVMNDVVGVGTLAGTFWDNKDPVNFTHDLAINNLKSVSPGVYRFFCDVNQVANGPISLTTFKFYVSSTAFTDATALNNFLGNPIPPNPVFDMNGGTQKYRVDMASDSGSGSGDMYVDVPLGTLPSDSYLYMVAGFGESGYEANGGFEEWWTRSGVPNTVPDTASAMGLLGIALSGIEILRRKIKA